MHYSVSGSREGARGPRSLLIFRPNWGPKSRKNCSWRHPPPPPRLITRSGSGTVISKPSLKIEYRYKITKKSHQQTWPTVPNRWPQNEREKKAFICLYSSVKMEWKKKLLTLFIYFFFFNKFSLSRPDWPQDEGKNILKFFSCPHIVQVSKWQLVKLQPKPLKSFSAP